MNILLKEFLDAYLAYALWSSSDESDKSGGNPFDKNYTVDDLAPECLAKAVADCEKFQAENAADIAGDLAGAGHDFWLTRNSHGSGFWDGDWPDDVGERLTAASKAFGEINLYVGDDGKIYS